MFSMEGVMKHQSFTITMEGCVRVQNKSKKTVSKTVVCISIVAVAVIAVLVGVIVYLVTSPVPELSSQPYGFPPVGHRIPGPQGHVLTPENMGQLIEQLEEVALEDRSYTVSKSNNWVFETALTPSGNARVSNLEQNSRTVFFDLLLSETMEVIFTSPFLPLGSSLEGFALDRDIGAGIHDTLLVIYLVDDYYEIITDVTVGVTITVLA